MGGSNAQTAAPLGSDYTKSMISALRMGNGGVTAATNMTPELRTADINGLQTMARREALINALNSRQMERDLTPDIAETRQVLDGQILSDLKGGPSVPLSNMWLKQGLNDVVATGANVDGGFARSALADETRTDYIADRDKNQAKASGHLAANPMPEAGLDIGSLAALQTQAASDNANARDAWKTNILSALQNQSANAFGALQQWGQMEASRRGANAQAANAASAANSAMWGNLAGAGIGALGGLGGSIFKAAFPR